MYAYNVNFLTYCCSCLKPLSLQVSYPFLCSVYLQSVQAKCSWCRQTDRYTQTDRQAGQGLVLLLFSAEAWPGDCWLMQNRNTGVEQLEGARERMREWVKAEARLMAGERDGAQERRVGGRREGETLSSQCESAGWQSFRVRLRHITATVNFPSSMGFNLKSISSSLM